MLYTQEEMEITSKDGSTKGMLVSTITAKDDSVEPTVTHNLYRHGDEASATYHGDEGVNEAITQKFGEGYRIWIKVSPEKEMEDGSTITLQVAFDADGNDQGARLKVKDPLGSIIYQELKNAWESEETSQ